MSTNIWNKANQKLVKVSGNATNNINDESSSIKDTWSAKKISDELGELDKKVGNVYSTEETVIGKWIDGKPIYRKVVDLTSGVNISNTSWANICPASTIGAVDKIINCHDASMDVNNSYSFRIIDGYFRAQSLFNGGNSVVKTFVIEYTKTTD